MKRQRFSKDSENSYFHDIGDGNVSNRTESFHSRIQAPTRSRYQTGVDSMIEEGGSIGFWISCIQMMEEHYGISHSIIHFDLIQLDQDNSSKLLLLEQMM